MQATYSGTCVTRVCTALLVCVHVLWNIFDHRMHAGYMQATYSGTCITRVCTALLVCVLYYTRVCTCTILVCVHVLYSFVYMYCGIYSITGCNCRLLPVYLKTSHGGTKTTTRLCTVQYRSKHTIAGSGHFGRWHSHRAIVVDLCC
jgi:hypothetical protein